MKHLKESIFDILNTFPFDKSESIFMDEETKRLHFSRDADRDLKLEIHSLSDSPRREAFNEYKKGEFIEKNNTIKLWAGDFLSCTASHIIHVSRRSKMNESGGYIDVDTYNVHTIEAVYKSEKPVSYVVDWVENISSGFFPNGNIDSKTEEFTNTVLGDGEASIEIPSLSKGRETGRIFFVNIGGVNVYIIANDRSKDKKYRAGMIVYGAATQKQDRDRMRECISFVFGRPIVYLGSSEYDNNWDLIRASSISASTFGGGAYDINSMPPFPVYEGRMSNVLDTTRFSQSVNALYNHYDDINFKELYWMYWYAVIAPVHSAALSYGAIIEHFQRSLTRKLPKINTKLVADEIWSKTKRTLLLEIDMIDVPDNEKAILRNKISNLNQVPSNLAFKRMIDIMQIEVGPLETDAWKHRNMAAHGGMSDNHIDTILGARLLRILFHRILACITSCNDKYIDYYSIGFPVRMIEEAVPSRR